MDYWWKPESGAFTEPELTNAGLLPRFADQESAEQWLGLCFTELLQHGVAEVSLYQADQLVYGPMLLEA